jgi:phosphoglycerate-specific signal transduction histidine kinase
MISYAQECDNVTQGLNNENSSLKQKLEEKERELLLVTTEKDVNTDSLLWRSGEYQKLEARMKEVIRENKKLVRDNRDLVKTLEKTKERLERQKFFHEYEVEKNEKLVAEAITNKDNSPKIPKKGLGVDASSSLEVSSSHDDDDDEDTSSTE